jgi:hypothetical protein
MAGCCQPAAPDTAGTTGTELVRTVHRSRLREGSELAIWLVSSLATIGGALGSFVKESDLAVREATYRYEPDEDDEVG